MTKPNDLLSQLLVYAQTQLISQKSVSWMFHGKNGKNDFVLNGIMDRGSVERFYTALRLFTLKHNIREYCVISEAWMLNSPTPIPDQPIATHPNRIETLVGVHVFRQNEKRFGKVKIFEIKRTPSGLFNSLERVTELEKTEIGGELFKFITPQTPSAEDSKAAGAVLKIGQQTMMYPLFEEITDHEESP